MFKQIGCFVLLLVLVGCGNQMGGRKWPAYIESISGFSADEKAQIEEAIDYINTTAGKTILTTTEAPQAFRIAIRRTETPAENQTRLGRAFFVQGVKCTIEITALSFEVEDKDLMKPLLAHEVGHCAGFDHVDEEGSIMFPHTRPLFAYATSAMSGFFQMLVDKVSH